MAVSGEALMALAVDEGRKHAPTTIATTAERRGNGFVLNGAKTFVAEAQTEDDELIVHACNLDDVVFGKETIFDFARHRRIEHYGLITEQTGAVEPPETT